jgi:hypothetical protein
MYKFQLHDNTFGEFTLRRPTTGNRWRLQDYLASREKAPDGGDVAAVRRWEIENYRATLALYVNESIDEIDFTEFDEGEFVRVQSDFFAQYQPTQKERGE